jgi:hypothetical protein
MPREQSIGECNSCSNLFGFILIHNGFNESSYAYCDSSCCVALLDHWKAPQDAPKLGRGVITPEVESLLLPCPTGGHFLASAWPRCPHCNELLDSVAAADYIERSAPGTAKGWRWQRSWDGLYCIIIEDSVARDPWKPRPRT